VNGGDPGTAEIADVQCGGDCVEPADHAIKRNGETEAAAEDGLEIALLSRGEAGGLPLEERRTGQEQPIVSAAEP
jgi:hypothetical protein